MVEVVSAFAGKLAPGRHAVAAEGRGVTFREILARDLVQVAWWSGSEIIVKGALAKDLGFVIAETPQMATERGLMTAFQVAPDRTWIAAPDVARLGRRLAAVIAPDRGVLTELGQAHSILRLTGPSAREVLARHLAIDLDPTVFAAGSFAVTGMQHASVLLHAVRDMAGADMFDLYLPRSLAVSLFERLTATAHGFGYAIEV